MRNVLIVFQRDIRELRRSPALIIVAIVFALLTIGAVVGSSLIVHGADLAEVRKQGEGVAQPIVQTIVGKILEPIIGFTVYFATMLPFVVVIWAFGATLMTKEKAAGNLETLLATPLSPLTVWLGKSLAIFLPAFALAIASTLVAVVAMNVAASILQNTAVFVLPPPVLVIGFLVNPLLFFGLTSLTIMLTFIHDPDVGIIPSFPIGFGLMYGVPLGVAVGAIDLTAWSFVLYDLGAAMLLWAAILYLSRFLTKEKIVLSSRSS
jgi:ABC-type transport system involved in multi-copper enzyme maturation permease subunit